MPNFLFLHQKFVDSIDNSDAYGKVVHDYGLVVLVAQATNTAKLYW